MTFTAAQQAEPVVVPPFPGAHPARCPFAPPDEYADWRTRPGLQRVRLWNGATAWAVTRYEDVRFVLRDPRISADLRNPGMPVTSPAGEGATPENSGFVRVDDPEHARLRRMVTRFFTVRKAEETRPWLEELVHDSLDHMIAKGRPADLVADFALPMPSVVISRMLGIPHEDQGFFHEKTSLLISLTSSVQIVRDARDALIGYLRDLVERKAREPGDDLVSYLVGEHVAKGELTRAGVAVTARMLLTAGHEPSANMIALGALVLLRHPEQMRRVRDTDDCRVVAGAVEELLRYLSNVENPVVRVAAEDVVIGGQRVRAGEGLVVSLPSANWDPAFAEAPDSFDIGRDTRGHLAFGHGVHLCLGAALARVQLQVALTALLRRLPDLRLAVPFEQVAFRADTTVHGLRELPVTW